MNGETILLVDDDKKLVDGLTEFLEKDGYEVLGVQEGHEALRTFRRREIDLVVLDLMLPEVDGLSICQKIRQDSDIPIIMLTAKTSEEDKIKGLDYGADDYVTKPFSPGELLARIRAVLRRVQEEKSQPDELNFGPLTINFPRKQAFYDNEAIELTQTEFKLLATMAQHPGQVFSRTELIHSALGYEYEGFKRTIDAHIKNLRKKIEPRSDDFNYIKTVYGAGYKFEPKEGL